MTTKIEEILLNAPSVYLTDEVLGQLLGGTLDSRAGRIRRAVAKGHLLRIKRGLYCVHQRFIGSLPNPFALAQQIRAPSYISLESALAYHHLIPEAVYTTTSVSVHRRKTYTTPLGSFSYHRIPEFNFYLGVDRVALNDAQVFWVASPWKAILDYLYCHKCSWSGMMPLECSLRVTVSELPTITQSELDALSQFYHHRRVANWIQTIPKEFIDVS